jgi:ribosomal protein L23
MREDLVIKKAVITEKTTKLAQKGWFTFAAGIKAGKNQIKTAVAKLFNVQVMAVRISRQGDKKKALVKLAPGQRIDLFVSETKNEKQKQNKKK